MPLSFMSRDIEMRNDGTDALPALFIVGVLLGILLTVVTYEFLPVSTVVKADSVIELCELDLPRTQHCILTAIPKEK